MKEESASDPSRETSDNAADCGALRSYFYDLLAKYLSLYIRPENSVFELRPPTDDIEQRFGNYSAGATPGDPAARRSDYILLNGTVHYERDIQQLFRELGETASAASRVLIVYYSGLWKPVMALATALRLRQKAPEQNWIAHEDLANLLDLAGFEIVRRESKILLPLYVPLLSDLINRYLAPLPPFHLFAMLNIAVARRVDSSAPTSPSVSIVVPARNESGNIESILARCRRMGPADELIFVEGNSTDDTWEKICEHAAAYRGPFALVTARQDGKGKGDAVRKGFSLARNEVLMILDADLTVPPEDLPKFYDALVSGKGEFINGSRLVYPMDEKAMRFLNMVANKFFASAFSLVLGQRFKDTLCGTKVLFRRHYQQLAAARTYFGEFDPFGDFDLIFGAARLGLKIVEIPIRYRERTYGETNISRWRHGLILLRMLIFAARKIRFT